MVEWSITAVLKTAALRGAGGSNPSLSAHKGNLRVTFFSLCSGVSHPTAGVLSVAPLCESVPSGRARIPLSPLTKVTFGLPFFVMFGGVSPHGRGSLAPSHFASVPSGRPRIPFSKQGTHKQTACRLFYWQTISGNLHKRKQNKNKEAGETKKMTSNSVGSHPLYALRGSNPGPID